jgi:hypothetical protein
VVHLLGHPLEGVPVAHALTDDDQVPASESFDLLTIHVGEPPALAGGEVETADLGLQLGGISSLAVAESNE